MNNSNDNSINFSGLSRRVLAVLADFACAYMLFYALLSFSSYEEKYNELSLLIFSSLKLKGSSGGALLSEVLGTSVFIFGIYLVLRFYSSLLLGVSLCQWLVGLRGVGNPVWKRVGAGARVVLEGLFGPILIGEFFLLFKHPSLKERLSHTRLTSTNNKLSLYSAFLWVPILLVFSTISPMFEGLTLMDGIVLGPVKEDLDLKKQGNFKKYKSYASNRFKFRAFSSLGDGRFLLLPNFEVVKEGSSKKIKPYLWIFDQKTKRDAFMKIEERFSLLKLLEKGRLGNPFFKRQFPSLAKTFEQDREDYLKKEYQKEYDVDKALETGTRNDIEKLIRTSLELGSESLFRHIFSFGPFYRGFVAVRNALIEKSYKGVVPVVDFGRVGNQSFLRFKQLFDKKVFLDKRMVETYVPLETNNSVALRFYWGEDLQSVLARKTFRESFLQSIKWYFDYFSIFPFPENTDEINSLTVLDHFTKMDLKPAQRKRLEESIFRIYFKLARKTIQGNDKRLQEVLLANLKRIHLVTNYINDLKSDYYSKKFLAHLRDLRFSLKKRDFNYFGIQN